MRQPAEIKKMSLKMSLISARKGKNEGQYIRPERGRNTKRTKRLKKAVLSKGLTDIGFDRPADYALDSERLEADEYNY